MHTTWSKPKSPKESSCRRFLWFQGTPIPIGANSDCHRVALWGPPDNHGEGSVTTGRLAPFQRSGLGGAMTSLRGCAVAFWARAGSLKGSLAVQEKNENIILARSIMCPLVLQEHDASAAANDKVVGSLKQLSLVLVIPFCCCFHFGCAFPCTMKAIIILGSGGLPQLRVTTNVILLRVTMNVILLGNWCNFN